MEVKIMDFKQPLKPINNVNNKQDSLKNKNFNSTLESVSNKTNNHKENSQDSNKVDSETSSNINSNSNSNSDKTKNTDKVNLENEKKIVDKKDYETGYEGIMFLFANAVEIKIDDEVNETISVDVNIDVEIENIISEGNVINNLETSEEPIVEEVVLNNETLKINESKKYNTEESEVDQIFDINPENYKNNSIKMDSKSDIKMLLNKDYVESEETLSINNINSSLNIIQTVKSNDLNNLDQRHDSEESGPYQEELLVKTMDNEDDLDVKDKSFVFFEKDVRIVDNTIEVDETDRIDKKDLIQQIVDKVKIDLSESKNEIRIKLKPEALGEMTMNIEVVKGEIVAKIMVDTQRTKEIIETNLIQLKEGIKDTALEIKTFEVFVGSGSDFDKHNSNQFNLKHNNKKIKIKAENNKTVTNYEENSLENKINSIGLYSENGLNLFA